MSLPAPLDEHSTRASREITEAVNRLVREKIDARAIVAALVACANGLCKQCSARDARMPATVRRFIDRAGL